MCLRLGGVSTARCLVVSEARPVGVRIQFDLIVNGSDASASAEYSSVMDFDNDTTLDLGLVTWPDPVNGSLPFDVQVLDPSTLIVALVLSVIVLLTVGGNVLILSAVMANSNLRGPTHILIANLAVADLLLGTLVLPFSATLEVTSHKSCTTLVIFRLFVVLTLIYT